MRLIDADALGIDKANPEMFENKGYADGWNSAIEILQQAPSIEAEPVRHGRWVRNDLGETYCSECHSRIPYVRCYDSYPDCCMDDEDMQWDEEIERTRFCPHCGAKMDLEG